MSYSAQPGALGDNILVGPSSDDIRDLDSKIAHLNTDVLGHASPTPESPSNPDWIAWQKFKIEWTSFTFQWMAWKAEHVNFFQRWSNTAAGEFESYSTQYNEYLRKFKEVFSGASTVAPSEGTGPSPKVPWGTVALATGAIAAGYWLFAMGGMASLSAAMASSRKKDFSSVR